MKAKKCPNLSNSGEPKKTEVRGEEITSSPNPAGAVEPTESDTERHQGQGLTPQQERAAVMLASGKSVGETARELRVHRSTVWEWRRLETFTAYHNTLVLEMQQQARDALLSLHDEAIKTLQRVMTTGGDTAALKAALYVLESVGRQEPGPTDPRELVRENCTSRQSVADIFEEMYSSHFDEKGYRARCRELGIES